MLEIQGRLFIEDDRIGDHLLLRVRGDFFGHCAREAQALLGARPAVFHGLQDILVDLTACHSMDSLETEALQALARHAPVWVFAGGGSIAGLLDLPPGVRVMTRGAGIRGGPRAP